MYGLDSSDYWQEGCRNSQLLIADRVDATGMFEFVNLMPRFPIPDGFESEDELFRAEVWKGMDRRYPDGYDEQRRKQAEYEIRSSARWGSPPTSWWSRTSSCGPRTTASRWARAAAPAAGSIVAYAMGITDLDPLVHGLIFERFLNPERVSMPDIDIDFDERGRADVIRYVTQKWGSDRVAQIITYGTIKAKAAIKDSCRVLGSPTRWGDRITKAFPPAVMGKDIPLSGIFDAEHPGTSRGGRAPLAVRGRGRGQADHRHRPRHRGPDPPARRARGRGDHVRGAADRPHPGLDPARRRRGHHAVRLPDLREPRAAEDGLPRPAQPDDHGRRGGGDREEPRHSIDLLSLPLDDKPTYELLARGDTLGVFQLDGGPMRSLLRLMKPDNFEDISAVIALYRPGPMGVNSHTNYALRKTGQQEITPIHPELEEPLREVLEPTYGLIVYQEQVQKAAQILAGYTLGQADLLRRAMGKKKKEILDKEFVPFQRGCRERGYSDKAIQAVWDVLVPFSGYAFNKAHTAAYGLISYWTAYLKANYPGRVHGRAAHLGGRRQGQVGAVPERVPPDGHQGAAARRQRVGSDVRGGRHRHQVRPGRDPQRGHQRGRRDHRGPQVQGPVHQLRRFPAQGPLVVCNKRVIESLVKAGAFDSFGDPRKGLVLVHEQAVDAVIDIKRNEAIGQDSLFGGDAEAEAVFDVPVPAGEWDKSTLLNFEREMLGLYVSDHPLFGVEHIIARESDCSLADLMAEDAEARPRSGDRSDAQIVKVGGILSGVQRKVTKQGNQWAAATLEDLAGAIEVLFFPQTYQLYATSIAEDAVVMVKGKVDRGTTCPS
jgi:DNA polymerase-3 subunit alpha